MNASSKEMTGDYKVADIGLAEFGRKEIAMATSSRHKIMLQLQ